MPLESLKLIDVASWPCSRAYSLRHVTIIIKNGFQIWESWIKVIGVKTMVITSAIFAVDLLNLKKKKKYEQMEGLVVFCQEV